MPWISLLHQTLNEVLGKNVDYKSLYLRMIENFGSVEILDTPSMREI
jgi:hypothetical protein